MNKYSDKLIQRTILHFKKKYDHIIDEEKADEYLDSMAGLFEVFIESQEDADINYNYNKILTK